MIRSGQGGGRPRDGGVDHAIEQAVRVAARAGVGKAAVYRRYRSKAELAFAVLIHDDAPRPVVDTGSLLGDLTEVAAIITRTLSRPLVRAATPGLLADLDAHPDIAIRLQQTFLAGEARSLGLILRQAADRGELPPGQDGEAEVEVLHATLLGAVFAWIFLLRRPVTAELPARLAALLAGSPAGAQASAQASPTQPSS
jgi:AcrR family transcriptional regulator